jgi:hypothetical protein
MSGRIKDLAGIALVGIRALVWVCAPHAKATVSIQLTNGTSIVTEADGSALDSCATLNYYHGPLGGYIVDGSTSFANNNMTPFLDSNSGNVTNTANAGLLTIMPSQIGYTTNITQFSFSVGSASTLGGNIAFSTYGGTNNTLFSTANQIGSTLNFEAVSPFSGDIFNPYSLTIVANLNGVNGPFTAASFDAFIVAVPERVTVPLLGVVLLLTATALRKKLNRPS